MISIILPLYNGEKYIANTIQKIINQTESAWELLIIDDGSTDHGRNIVQKYCEKDKRIKYFYKSNGGICSARNYGLSKAEGEFIGFIDQDDEPLPNMYQLLLKGMKDEHIGLVVGGQKLQLISDTDGILETIDRAYSHEIIDSKDKKYRFVFNRLNNQASQHIWNCLYRKSLIKKNRLYFDENFKHGIEDIVFNFIYAQHCQKINIIHNIVYIYKRRLGESTSTKYNPDAFTDFKHATDVIGECMDTSDEHLYQMYESYTLRFLIHSFCQNQFVQSSEKEILRDYVNLYLSKFPQQLRLVVDKSTFNKNDVIYFFIDKFLRIGFYTPVYILKKTGTFK